jgi:hypothetical protein
VQALVHRAAALPPGTSPAAVCATALAACAVLAVADPNRPGVYPSCPFRLATGLDCPGCGTLRAVHALTGGDVLRALDHNLLTVLLLPVLVWGWAGWLAMSLGRRARPPALSGTIGMGVAVTVGAFWVLRNLPVAGLSWLASGAG